MKTREEIELMITVYKNMLADTYEYDEHGRFKEESDKTHATQMALIEFLSALEWVIEND